MIEPTEEDFELLPGGDFIAPDVSDEVRDFIQACRKMIYSEEFTPIVQQALTGAGSLTDGVVPVLVELVTRAEDKLGPLSDQDQMTVITHLAGTLVSTAKMLGDPDAEDGRSAVEAIVDAVSGMLDQGAPQEEPPAPETAPAAPLAQLR